MDPLPVELLLPVATSSPQAWYALVRALPLLARLVPTEKLKAAFGRPLTRENTTVTVLPDGTFHGPCRTVYQGWVYSESSYRDGLLWGTLRRYYPDGSLSVEANYSE